MGITLKLQKKGFCYPVDAPKRNSYKIYRLQWQFLEDENHLPGSEKDTAAGPYYCNGIDGLQSYVYIWLGGYANKDAVATVTLLV